MGYWKLVCRSGMHHTNLQVDVSRNSYDLLVYATSYGKYIKVNKDIYIYKVQ